jgi:hypothetical protein
MTSAEIDALIRGEEQAVRKLVRDYGPVMRGVVRRRLHGELHQYVDPSAAAALEPARVA